MGLLFRIFPKKTDKDLIFQACFTSSAWLNKKGCHMYNLMFAATELFQTGVRDVVSGHWFASYTRLDHPS